MLALASESVKLSDEDRPDPLSLTPGLVAASEEGLGLLRHASHLALRNAGIVHTKMTLELAELHVELRNQVLAEAIDTQETVLVNHETLFQRVEIGKLVFWQGVGDGKAFRDFGKSFKV